jgi:succinyl-CoA synthetase alpha subunit
VCKCGCFIAESYLACIIVLFDRQFCWGTGERTLVPVYQKMEEAFEKHPGGCNRLRKLCVVLFRSISSILPSWKHSSFWTRSRLSQSLLKCVPESQTRALNKEKTKKNVGIIGPATVGGINVSRSNMLCVQYCMNMRESHVDHHRFSFRTFSPGTFESETLAA